jgi:hypothetical protein
VGGKTQAIFQFFSALLMVALCTISVEIEVEAQTPNLTELTLHHARFWWKFARWISIIRILIGNYNHEQREIESDATAVYFFCVCNLWRNRREHNAHPNKATLPSRRFASNDSPFPESDGRYLSLAS